jgi:hypothetical protein
VAKAELANNSRAKILAKQGFIDLPDHSAQA